MFRQSFSTSMWFSRSKYPMKSMMESHFWSLTRYRIGPRFLGLDYAGNIIFFRAYRKQTFGGWTAVTLGAPGSGGIFSCDNTASNVLEDGYPMHYKASQKIQLFITQERKKWESSVKAQKEQSEKKAEGSLNSDIYDSDQRFRDMLIIKCSHPKFFSHTLRLSPIKTALYKCCYFYLWLVVVAFIVQGYFRFRDWLNPPAREGLVRLEEHALHVPRLLFAAFIKGVAWLVREAEPVINPIVDVLETIFPGVAVHDAEGLAKKADHLAVVAHPDSKHRQQREQEGKLKRDQVQQSMWFNILAIIVALLVFLSVL